MNRFYKNGRPGKNRFPLALLLFCVFTGGLYPQGVTPASPADTDRESVNAAQTLAGTLNSLGGLIHIGDFAFNGENTLLGILWTANLQKALVNQENKTYTILENPSPSVYTVRGEIIDVITGIRLYTRIVKNEDSSILLVIQTDLPKDEFIQGLLESPGGGLAVFRDAFEDDSRENPVTINPGVWVSRSFHNENDEDWFVYVPQENHSLILETAGDTDTYMELYEGGSGSPAYSNDDGGSNNNAKIEYQVRPGIRYLIKVRGYDRLTGRYRFRALAGDPINDSAEPNDNREQAYAITAGQNLETYFISPSDIDLYKLSFPPSGKTVTVYTEGSLDTLITAYDSDGDEIGEDDDGGESYNARLTIDVPRDGILFLMVRELDHKTGGYILKTEIHN